MSTREVETISTCCSLRFGPLPSLSQSVDLLVCIIDQVTELQTELYPVTNRG